MNSTTAYGHGNILDRLPKAELKKYGKDESYEKQLTYLDCQDPIFKKLNKLHNASQSMLSGAYKKITTPLVSNFSKDERNILYSLQKACIFKTTTAIIKETGLSEEAITKLISRELGEKVLLWPQRSKSGDKVYLLKENFVKLSLKQKFIFFFSSGW